MYIIDFSDCVISQFSLIRRKLNGCIKNYMMSYHGDRDQMLRMEKSIYSQDLQPGLGNTPTAMLELLMNLLKR